MGQEFIIKSQKLEDKVNQLLPSQGGFQAGVDLSASTTIIPIIDLTESAEGSEVRPDLQTALSHKSVTEFDVQNTTTTIINTTGYFRVFGACSLRSNTTSSVVGLFRITDGSTTKDIAEFLGTGGVATAIVTPFDFVTFFRAGDSLAAVSSSTDVFLRGCTRQIADISGNLVDP